MVKLNPVGHPLYGAELLRRVWQRRSLDVGGRVTDVLISDPQAQRQEGQVQIPRNGPRESSIKIKLLL